MRMTIHAAAAGWAAAGWVAPSWGCPSVRLQRGKKIFIDFAMVCERDILLIAFTKYCEAHEGFFFLPLQTDTWRHDGALSRNRQPPRKWHQRTISFEIALTTLSTIGKSPWRRFLRKAHFDADRHLESPMKGLSQKNSSRRGHLESPMKGLSENFLSP